MCSYGSSLPLTELHWLAGLLEGEGSFMTGPPSSPGLPVIAVNMTDQDVMARLGRIFERRVHVVKPRNLRWRTRYQVRVNGRGGGALDERAEARSWVHVAKRRSIVRWRPTRPAPSRF